MRERGQHITDVELRETVRVYEETGRNKAETARRLGLVQLTVRRRIKTAAKRGWFEFDPVMPGFEIKKTSAQLDKLGNVQKQWVQQQPESDGTFELPEGHNVKGVSALVDADGNVRQQWIKTHRGWDADNFVETVKKAFEEFELRAPLIAGPDCTDDELLTVYPIADLHNGMLSWGRETGADYDTKIAHRLLMESMTQLVTQSYPSRHAIVLNLGDWQHTNDQKNMTPRGGNLLDVDSRFEKLLFSSAQLQIQCAELALLQHERVTFVNIKGNHDPEVAVSLTLALKCFYHDNQRLNVDTTPGEFFFHRFGNTLIGAHHGHRAKADQLAMKMATDCRADWGATEFHYFYKGHIHHEEAKEIGGVRVESFQTIAPKDAYSASQGYTSGRSLCAITIHKERGEIGRHRVNIRQEKVA